MLPINQNPLKHVNQKSSGKGRHTSTSLISLGSFLHLIDFILFTAMLRVEIEIGFLNLSLIFTLFWYIIERKKGHTYLFKAIAVFENVYQVHDLLNENYSR